MTETWKNVIKMAKKLLTKKTCEEIIKLAEEQDNRIKELEKAVEEKDKVIDEMAKYIEDNLTIDEFCGIDACYADNYEDGHCQKCLNCIKQYFEKKEG